MGTGPERQARIHQQPRHIRRDLRGVPLPLRHNVQLLPHGQRAVILLPAVGPVILPQRHGRVGQINILQITGQLFFPVGVVRHIELHAGDALHLLHELVVHIVPILPVFLQESPELFLFLHRQSGHAVGDERGAQGVHLFGFYV